MSLASFHLFYIEEAPLRSHPSLIPSPEFSLRRISSLFFRPLDLRKPPPLDPRFPKATYDYHFRAFPLSMMFSFLYFPRLLCVPRKYVFSNFFRNHFPHYLLPAPRPLSVGSFFTVRPPPRPLLIFLAPCLLLVVGGRHFFASQETFPKPNYVNNYTPAGLHRDF